MNTPPPSSKSAARGADAPAALGALEPARRRLPEGAQDGASDGMHAQAFEWAPDPTALLRADGAMIAANVAFRAAFRFTVSAQRPPWGRTPPPPFVDGERQFEAAAPDGRIYEWRERILPDGARLACARDVTARSAHAAAADRAKTALFATLTHELRTPLNGVLGMAGLLARSPLDASQADYVSALRRSGEHLLDLITEILDFSRLEAGRIVLDDAPFSPEEVLRDVVELLSPKAYDKGLEVVASVHPDVPAQVRGDAGRVRQVLFNLVGNAIKFTDTGGVAVVMATAGPGRYAIAVRDTGIGVPEDKQSLIFEEFGQADIAHARLHGGTGLGLAIVRKLVHTLGGGVRLTSKPGAGSTFTVELPFAAAAPPLRETPLAGLKLLLICVNPILSAEAAAMLRGLGAAVETASAPPRQIDADVILYDHPPGAAPPARLPQAAPVIVLAPQEERAALSAYQARGATHYLLKPLRRRSVIQQVQAAAARAPMLGPAAQDEREADPGQDQSLAGLKVLVADDNPINAMLARALLTRVGCVVHTVGDGQEAVAAAQRAAPPFDLILLDLRMPGVDGFAAARLIRAGPQPLARTPLIALTADSADEDRKAALAAGMDDFLTKPINLARLVHAVSRFTGRANPATLPSESRAP